MSAKENIVMTDDLARSIFEAVRDDQVLDLPGVLRAQKRKGKQQTTVEVARHLVDTAFSRGWGERMNHESRDRIRVIVANARESERAEFDPMAAAAHDFGGVAGSAAEAARMQPGILPTAGPPIRIDDTRWTA
jgi:hypothetical protein